MSGTKAKHDRQKRDCCLDVTIMQYLITVCCKKKKKKEILTAVFKIYHIF